MPTATYIPLATYTVPSGGDSEVIFGSIPNTYRDLVLAWSGTISTLADIIVQPNSIGTAYYSRVVAEGTGSSTNSSASSTLEGFYPLYTGSSQSNFILQIFDYAATDKHKTALNRGNGTGTFTVMSAFRWPSTNAISSLRIIPTGGSFNSGSTFSLYGIIG